MAGVRHHITIQSRTSQLARVRNKVAFWAEEAGLSAKAANALQLAVDEACANAIEHGYDGKATGKVDVEARLKKDAIVITVRHHGAPFNPKLHTLATLSEMRSKRKSHGYGLHLITKLVDDVSFRTRGRSSEVKLTKRR